MRTVHARIGVLLVICGPAVLAGQTPASGAVKPAGPPERPPVRVDAGGACVVDLVQDYTIDGSLNGELRIDYRILVAGPCGSPAGTFEEEWIAHGRFSGIALGREATAELLYTARVTTGGSVDGTMVLKGDVQGELQIGGDFADGQLSYSGVLQLSQDGGGEPAGVGHGDLAGQDRDALPLPEAAFAEKTMMVRISSGEKEVTYRSLQPYPLCRKTRWMPIARV